VNTKKGSYSLRTYREGDEEEIIKLFNSVHKDYAGVVPRTVSYWRWCCKGRPDVSEDGILIVEEEQSKEIVGYAVIGKSGNVWEICVNPNFDKKQIVSLLLEKATEYLTKAGTDEIVLNVPAENSVLRETIEELGLTEFPIEHMFVGVLDFATLITQLAQNNADKLRRFEEVFSFRLKNARSWVDPQFAIKIDNGAIATVPYTESNSILVEIDVDAFTSILIGTTNPFRLLISRKVKVRPLRKTFKTLKFFSLIQIRDPWFHPRADFG
jgi:ribosomal protein S18 acetylase RimI-like enzyme